MAWPTKRGYAQNGKSQDTHDKFPDAIVHATALQLGLPLYTRDKKIRSLKAMPDIVIYRPYDDQDSPQLTAAMISGIRMDTFSPQDFNHWREGVILHLAQPGEPPIDL